MQSPMPPEVCAAWERMLAAALDASRSQPAPMATVSRPEDEFCDGFPAALPNAPVAARSAFLDAALAAAAFADSPVPPPVHVGNLHTAAAAAIPRPPAPPRAPPPPRPPSPPSS